ncbi:hypothetical protein [Enterobacter cloacae complex sp. 301C7]|uniref:hypothetical protein n=1 Tax=Enterobacter cloacae complex sp. 301C7 TaxID=3395848 RepID=UPI003CF874C8
MNELLSHFFGHDGIELEAKDNVENTSIKFEVTRDGKSAYNLSEGECSLIAFLLLHSQVGRARKQR